MSDCQHKGKWQTWPDNIDEKVLLSGKHGTRCVDCGQELSLEAMLAVYTDELQEPMPWESLGFRKPS